MRKNILAIAILLTNTAFAQKQANNWYFGANAGLSFSEGTPTALTNGALYTNEGCASISDKNGSLLFYSDGVTVWNRGHIPMPNGDSLWGHMSTTQSALVIPKPGSDSIYYLFTADAFLSGGYGGLSYSIISMNRGGGLGNVITKNIPLLTPATEKLNAVRHSDGCSIWVLAHQYDSDAFYAYRISAAGIDAPVISNAGTAHMGDALGQMKFSPDGKKVAVACYAFALAELFDFNASTGKVSDPVKFSSVQTPYGVSFSPDNSKLYISDLTKLYQYDLHAGLGTGDEINASRTEVGTYPMSIGSLQLGPDKKIYAAELAGTALGVINFPNNAGAACNYVSGAVSLGGKACTMGLPNYIESYFDTTRNTDFIFSPPCHNAPAQFTDASLENTISWSWNFGDMESGAENNSTLSDPQHIFTSSETYYVKLKTSTSCSSDSVTKTITVSDCAAEYKIPNVFSPNNDGKNDEFKIELININSVQGTIYNRWGGLIFSWDDAQAAWNGLNESGETAPEGVYYYVVNLNSVSGKLHEEKGTLTLVR